MANDYYETLGVKRGASEDEIRRAYREMARKHHPDLNQGDEAAKKKFQDVQLAFEVLGDPKKREKYDRFGPNFEAMGGGHPGGAGGGQPFDFDLNDLFGGGGGMGGGGPGGGFADLFRQMGGGRGGRGARTAQPTGPPRGSDLEHEITVPFATAVLGGEASLSVRRADGSAETISVKIPVGIEDGKKIRLRGQGDPSPGGGPDGDLLLTVRVANHPHFTRRGSRLDVTLPITLAEAAAGAKIDVPTPKGTVTLSIPAGTSSGKRLRVKGHGVAPTGKPVGDLYVELQIVLPESLTVQQREELAKIAGEDPPPARQQIRW